MTCKPISRRDLAKVSALAVFASRPGRARASLAGRDVFFIRHAESEVNVAFDPMRADQGVSYPLTALGVQQAAAIGRRFASLRPQALYASTQLRAVQTADAISFGSGLPIRLSPELVEVGFGRADPQLTHAESLAAIRSIYLGWLAGETDLRAPGGESFEQVRARVMGFVGSALKDAAGTGPVIFVSHRATLMTMGPQLFANVTPAFAATHPLPNCGVIHARQSASGLKCLTWDEAVPSERS